MATDEIKNKFHKLIDDIEDEGLLNFLYEDAAEYQTKAKIEPELTEDQIRQLQKAEEDIKNGNYLTHEQVMHNLRNAGL